MSLKPSTASTDMPDDFLGGVSLTNYTSPWSHSPWIDTDITDTTRIVLQWIQPDAGTRVSLSADFLDNPPRRDELVRLLCHFVLGQVPTEGLDEVGDTLAGIYNFYTERAQADKLLPSPTTVETAALGKAYDREPFYITEE